MVDFACGTGQSLLLFCCFGTGVVVAVIVACPVSLVEDSLFGRL